MRSHDERDSKTRRLFRAGVRDLHTIITIKSTLTTIPLCLSEKSVAGGTPSLAATLYFDRRPQNLRSLTHKVITLCLYGQPHTFWLNSCAYSIIIIGIIETRTESNFIVMSINTNNTAEMRRLS